MGKKDDEEKPEKDDPHRQIVPVAEGEVRAILSWLESLFYLSPKDNEPGKPKTEPDEMPERVALRPVYGKLARDRSADDLRSKEWKPMSSPLPSKEMLVQLANMFHGAAVDHCSALGAKQKYGLFAYSNLKSSKSYSHVVFVIFPSHKTYEEGEEPASDDEDTLSDRQRRDDMAHIRWKEERLDESLSSVIKLQQEIIKQQQEAIRQRDEDRRAAEVERRQWITIIEQAESKKLERDILMQMAQVKVGVIKDIVSTAKGYLGPLVAYATKGKVGIAEGLKELLEALSGEVRVILFGAWDTSTDPPVRQSPGILDEAQVNKVLAIVGGQASPASAKDLILSLRPDQFAKIQGGTLPDGSPILTGSQLGTLMALAKTATEVVT